MSLHPHAAFRTGSLAIHLRDERGQTRALAEGLALVQRALEDRAE